MQLSSYYIVVTVSGEWSTSPNTYDNGITAAYAVTILLALTGNSLLIFIVRKRPETRTLTSCLFVNMAAADLLVALVVMPVSLATPYTKGKWLPGLVGHVTCKFVYYSFFVSLTASILSLVAMAVDRFLAVRFPLRRFERFRRARVVISVIWLSSMVFMIPIGVIMSLEGSYCEFRFSQFGEIRKSVRGFYTYLFLLIYLLPLFVITILYGLVCHKLWLRKTPGFLTSEIEQRNDVTKRKVVCRLVIIVVVFALCWLPAQAFHMILAFNFKLYEDLPTYVMSLCFWVGHANSAVNPWLYMALNDKFQRAICNIVHSKPSRSPLVANVAYSKVSEPSSAHQKREGDSRIDDSHLPEQETTFSTHDPDINGRITFLDLSTP